MSDISYEKHGAVRLITINRADKMNSLTFEANDDLVAAWHEFDNDESARAAVITGACGIGPRSGISLKLPNRARKTDASAAGFKLR